MRALRTHEDVQVYQVRQAPLSLDVLGRATLLPSQVFVVTATVDGTLLRTVATVGDKVTQDSVLVELGNPEIDQGYDDARAKVALLRADQTALQADLAEQSVEHATAQEEAKSNLRIAESELKAMSALIGKGVVSQLAFDKTKATEEQAQARERFAKEKSEQFERASRAKREAAAARLQQAQDVVERMTSKKDALKVKPSAPGILTKIDATTGQHVAAGAPLAEVMGPGLRADVQIAQGEVDRVNDQSHVVLRFPQGVIQAHVRSVLPRATEGQAHVIADLDEAPSWARADMVGDATLSTGTHKQGIVVHAPAGVRDNRSQPVRIVGTDGRVTTRMVSFGQRVGADIQIVSGLRPGDRILAELPEADAGVER